ncbi:MAG: DUF502 domain-containing protein [Dehalococcoidales bacterium]|jgi:uncharacterized membrane protein
MEESAKKSGGNVIKKIRAQFIAGIVLVVPVGVIIWILVWLFSAIDSILQPLVKAVWGDSIPGVGFGATVVLVYLAGLVASNVVGKRLIRYGESLLSKVPVLRQLYTGIRQILESFSTPGKTGFMQVVLVEFPRKGMRAIGFVTNELTDKSGEKLLSVLIPTSPNPTTGFLQIVREEDVVRTRITVDDALKMVVSGGRMTSPEVMGKIPSA